MRASEIILATEKLDLRSMAGASHPTSPPRPGGGKQQLLATGSPVEYNTAANGAQTSPLGYYQTSGSSPIGNNNDPVEPYDAICATQRSGGPEGPSESPYVQTEPRRPGTQKEAKTAYKLAILGFLGLHHFYLERPKFGVLYIFTGGLLLIGWLLDLCRMPLLVKQANDMIDNPENFKNRRTVLDAYVVWFPLGIFGAHHYYLGRTYWGVAYTFTLGLLGIGWLIDGARMKQLVRNANETLSQGNSQQNPDSEEKKLTECYILAVTPLGILGAHYYYLERWMFAVMYTFTLGLFGVGWLVDLCTLPYVFERANKIRRKEVDPKRVYITEAYKLIFPLGFLGLHHFYLRRPGWGFLYLCTFGCLAVGWIVDLFRLPSLVRETNAAVEIMAANISELENRLHGQPIEPAEVTSTHDIPTQHSPRPMLTRYPPHADSVVTVRVAGRKVTPVQKKSITPIYKNDLPPPYSPRAPPLGDVMSPMRPVASPMDVISEEDEDAISVISSASRQLASANDVTLENSLNEQIHESSLASNLCK